MHGYYVTANYFNPAPCMSTGSLSSSVSGPCADGPGFGTTANGGQPYWVISATKKTVTVETSITNVTYEDTSYGDSPVPAGYNVIFMDFSIDR
jgi:hypothetical protein